MKRTYNQLFESLPDIDPPMDLEGTIIKIVRSEQKKLARIYFATQSIISGASLVGLIETGIYLLNSFKKTGFYEYASLIFSDPASLSNIWKEFIFSLVESLPALTLIVFLSVTTLFIWSLLKALRDARTALLPA